MDQTTYFALVWGAALLTFGLLSITADRSDDADQTARDKESVSTSGALSFFAGLITVIFHNVWVWDWPLAITILGWSAMINGLVRLLFANLFRKYNLLKYRWVTAILFIALGASLLLMGL